LRPHIQFILIAGLIYIYIKCFITFNSGYGSKGCRSSLIYALMDLRVKSEVLGVDVVGRKAGSPPVGTA
jgi:hypothetical protein